MNCLILTPNRYGIREVAKQVGAEWEAMGHTVDYDLPDGEPARVAGVTVGVPGIALWWYRTLRRVAQTGDHYDLVWTHQPLAPLLPTREPSFWKRVIITFHTTERAEYELAREGVYPTTRRPYLWITKMLEASFYRRLERLDESGPSYTVVAPHLREEISEFGVGSAKYIPNGIFAPDPNSFASIRAEHRIPDDATLIVSIGSLTPQKRPVCFARTLHEVTEDSTDVYCVIVGDGPLREAVEEYTTDRVIAVGYVPEEEKWRWLAGADVFASLSAYEGMPVATMEALSFGLPVILSDIGAHRHVVENLGATGALVRPVAASVCAAIQELQEERTEASMPTWREAAEAYVRIVSK